VLPPEAPGALPKITPIGVVELAGALDLKAADAAGFGAVLADPAAEPPKDAPEPARPEAWPAVADAAGEGIVPLLVGGHVADRPEHYAWTSPLELAGAGVPVLAVHGTADEAVPAEWSRRYAEKVDAKGGSARYLAVEGGTHFDVVRPSHPVCAEVTGWIRETVTAPGAGTRPPVRG
jgi:fermentation-respiration switch protein FrsA (DUF1100 family)